MILERVTGRPCYAEIERRILGPFELRGAVPQTSRSIAGLVPGYLAEDNPFGAPTKTLDADGRFFLNPQFEYAGGGFVDNGGTLARWAKVLYEGPLLEPATRARMVAGEDASRELGPGTRYGLACEVWSTPHGEAWGHAGFFPGYLTEMRCWPEHRIAVAVQVNTSEYAWLPEPLGKLCGELLALALEPAAD
jgi:D-alanyl-D-alanine carboxypeptidase